jgi:DNA-binding MarR family transcriptional regulator
MNSDWQTVRQPPFSTVAVFLPPATVDATAWDILLAVHSDPCCELNLHKLAGAVSAPKGLVDRWLAVLEQRQLITRIEHRYTGEIRAALTEIGRELIDIYLSATSTLQAMLTAEDISFDLKIGSHARPH